MPEPVSVTQSVTFAPIRYPLRWAERADDVPAWDVSRGVSVAAYWQEYPSAPQETMPAVLLGDTSEDEALTWGGGDAPSDAAAYPRLVCAKPHVLKDGVLPAIRPSQAVAGLAHFVGKSSFKRKVLEVASSYALINPAQGDTLCDWKRFVWRTAFTMHLIRDLLEARKGGAAERARFSVEAAFDYASMCLPESARDREQQAFMLEFVFQQPHLERGDRTPLTAEGASHRLYAHLWAFFGRSTKIELSGGRFNAVCGLDAWVRYELALALRDASAIGQCVGCGRPFYKRHAKQKVCDPKKSSCRMRAKRRGDAEA